MNAEDLNNLDIINEVVAVMPFQIEVALKMIPEFDGAKVNLHRFMSCCDIVAQSCTTQQQHNTLLNVIKTKLSGSAYDIVKYKAFENWEELKLILQNQYLEKRTLAQIQSELISIIQLPNESVQEFANRVERLTVDLTDAGIASEGADAAETIQNLNSKLALRSFVEGLRAPFKLLIKASRFDSLPEAVTAACEEERVQNFKRPASSPNSYRQNFKPKDIKCYTCGRNNHTSAQCRFNNKGRFPQYPTNNFKFQNHPKVEANIHTIICRYCKKLGHKIEDCRKRKFNNDRKQNQVGSDSNQGQRSGNESGPGTSGSAPRVQQFQPAH